MGTIGSLARKRVSQGSTTRQVRPFHEDLSGGSMPMVAALLP